MTGLHGPGSENNRNWGSKYAPMRDVAIVLTQAIEDTMMILWASHKQYPVQLHESWEKAFVAYWSVNCSMGPEFYKSRLQMSLRRSVDGHGILDGPWKADAAEIEAMLSLWLWSMKQPTKGYDEEDPDIKTVEPRINRILSVHSDTAHTDTADRDDDIHEAMQLSLWQKRVNNGLQAYKLRNYHLAELAKSQHAVWWREGDEFVTNSNGPPGLLQPPEEVIAMVGKLADNHLKQKRWSKYAELANWRIRLLREKVSKRSHEQDSAEANEATKELRSLVIDNCKGFLQALEGDDEAAIAGYGGIVHLLDRYSKDETIKNIPYAESDQGTGSGGGSGAQAKGLAGIIVYCGEAARSRLEQKYPLSAGSEDKRLLSRLREHGTWKD
ncbi:hypothetical protein BHE90_013699 [Fusarium euwallaceae]|uniref:Uncharacterized protein n=1 Tax=Fusarium euwallaceae TaxID=1147111 RepID=A0A430L829_9HYPO|nr:hypothetical protein BHE90_013699 [Fusarium euwallaceae]